MKVLFQSFLNSKEKFPNWIFALKKGIQKSSLCVRHCRANVKQKLKYIFSVYSECILANSIKVTAGLPKHERERKRDRQTEEVKLKYPGRTNGHRPVWHHVSSDLWAGGMCSRTGSASLQETLNTKLLQELQKGLVVAAFPCSTQDFTAMQNLATLILLEDLRLPALRAPQCLESFWNSYSRTLFGRTSSLDAPISEQECFFGLTLILIQS